MAKRIDNPIVDLAELFVADTDASASEPAARRDFSLQLRFGEVELVDGDVIFTVAVQRAYVGLDLVGLSVDQTSRYGDSTRENEVVVERRREEKKATLLKGKVGASAKALVSSFGLEVEGSASGEKSVLETLALSDKDKKTRVTPRGGDKWEIVEPDGKPLEGRYLDNEKVLCRLIPRKGANQRSATAQVYVKQRDLIFKREGNNILRRKLTKNEERMLNILVAKVLRTQGVSADTKTSGYLVLSEVEVDYEN